MRRDSRAFRFGKAFQLPFRVMVKINIVQRKNAVGVQVYLDGFIARVNQPIFPDAGVCICVFFISLVTVRCAAGKHLDDQIGRAVYAVGLDFITVTNNHHVRLENILFR